MSYYRSKTGTDSIDTLTEMRPENTSGPSNRVRRRSMVRVVNQSVTVVDAFTILLSSVLADLLYNGVLIDAPVDLARATGVGTIAAFATIACYAYLGLYRSSAVLRPRSDTIHKVVIGWMGVLAALVLAAFMSKTSAEFSRGWVIVWLAFSLPVLIGARLAVSFVAPRVLGRNHLAQHVAIVGNGTVAEELAAEIRKQSPEYVLVGLFEDIVSDRNTHTLKGATPRGSINDLLSLGSIEPLDQIIIALPQYDDARLRNLVNDLAVLPVDVQVCTILPLQKKVSDRVLYLGGKLLVPVLTRPIGEWAWVAKGIMDRAVAFCLLVLTAPLMLLIALTIRLESKGPALFRQRRNGFNQEIIVVLKFRTMTVAEDGSTINQATSNDKRITRVGRLLRASSLDELPQLINVLKGDMSLVGPRPHAIAHNLQYVDLINLYANRHRVKPGITGLAQVNGFRGETETVDKMKKRIEQDLHYIDNWTLWLDIKILIKTAFVFPFQKNAR